MEQTDGDETQTGCATGVLQRGGGGEINTALPANINITFIQSDQDFNNDVLKTFSIHRSQRVFVIECSFTDTHLMFL